MTLKKIFELGLISDSTKVYVRDPDMHVLAKLNNKKRKVKGYVY